MEWRDMLEKTPNLDFWQDMVIGLIVEGKKVVGVETSMGQKIRSKAIILTNGTFLNGIIHIGTKKFEGGRIGERASVGITEELNKLGFVSDRMKTGTPVRVDGRTIDFSKLQEQPGDNKPGKFSFTNTPVLEKQRSCYMAYTSQEVHDILRTGFEESPMFNGRIEGIGPRYCPSIEDKSDRFADKTSHQLFVEPEGWNTVEYYINGFSSSLPDYVQYKALIKIQGFENAKIFRPGYAIEYDYFPPVQLKYSLETKLVENLYFAGQINGTTGYEEAAAQGLMAGINVHRKLNNQSEFILKRSEAYIGVLIDDLITKGVDEPYRMFTSRAEYRILLRQNNADLRLTPKGYDIGLVDTDRMKLVSEKTRLIEKIITFLKKESVNPAEVEKMLVNKGTSKVSQKVKISSILSRPQISIFDLYKSVQSFTNLINDNKAEFIKDCMEEAEILIKYGGYIDKEQGIASKLNELEDIYLSPDFNYFDLQSLSYEAREKLSKIKPNTIGQASRISGVSPSDISVLAVYIGR
jgi:tRNA uridine 5-carboxymethylaminomethyl modification enzyme